MYMYFKVCHPRMSARELQPNMSTIRLKKLKAKPPYSVCLPSVLVPEIDTVDAECIEAHISPQGRCHAAVTEGIHMPANLEAKRKIPITSATVAGLCIALQLLVDNYMHTNSNT